MLYTKRHKKVHKLQVCNPEQSSNFCHHQLTAMMIQEARMQGHGIHEIESSSRGKLHLYYSGHKDKLITQELGYS